MPGKSVDERGGRGTEQDSKETPDVADWGGAREDQDA